MLITLRIVSLMSKLVILSATLPDCICDRLSMSSTIFPSLSDSSIIIEQDFYATVLLSNIASISEQEEEESLREKNSKEDLKHEYKINKNILVGKLKNTLIEMLLEEDDEKKAKIYERFVEEIKRNVVPVIPDRNVGRNKNKKRANKYSKNRRRAL